MLVCILTTHSIPVHFQDKNMCSPSLFAIVLKGAESCIQEWTFCNFSTFHQLPRRSSYVSLCPVHAQHLHFQNGKFPCSPLLNGFQQESSIQELNTLLGRICPGTL